MKTKIASFVFFLYLFLPGYGQVENSLAALPLKKGILNELLVRCINKKRVELLKLIPATEKMQFERSDVEPELTEEENYFPLDTSGLYYLDIDEDGDLDLVYAGQSGLMGRTGTKIYLNTNNKLHLAATLPGGILEIIKMSGTHYIYTLEKPCCDSYTTRITEHSFLKDSIIKTGNTMFMIGLVHLGGLPEFEAKPRGSIDGTLLYAMASDFKNVSPYFGKRTAAIRDSLRNGYSIPIATVKAKTRVNVLDKQTINKEVWYLVLTENTSLSTASLFEFVHGQHNRFVGWVKNVKLD